MILQPEVYSLSDKNPNVTLTAYVAGTSKELPFNEKRKAVFVIPGGAYAFCSDREGEPLALEFLTRGYNAFVLRYSVSGKGHFPDQLIEASAAMKLIRDNAEKFHVDPDFIYVIGFSAGGHLACSLGTLWYKDYIYKALDMEFGYNRPRGMILAYPVISSGKYAHRGSIENLLGDKRDDRNALKEVSLEYSVTKKTVPAYIWHTVTDTTVPVENSLLLCQALSKKKIPFELHVMPSGGHGMSLCNEVVRANNPYNARWFDEAVHWMGTV